QRRATGLAQRAEKKQRVQRASEPAPRGERELVKAEAQGYPEYFRESKQRRGDRRRVRAANLTEPAGANPRAGLRSCVDRQGALCVFPGGAPRAPTRARRRRTSS